MEWDRWKLRSWTEVFLQRALLILRVDNFFLNRRFRVRLFSGVAANVWFGDCSKSNWGIRSAPSDDCSIGISGGLICFEVLSIWSPEILDPSGGIWLSKTKGGRKNRVWLNLSLFSVVNLTNSEFVVVWFEMYISKLRGLFNCRSPTFCFGNEI